MNEMERIEYPIKDVKLIELYRVFTFKQGETRCDVLISLNGFGEWKKLDPSVESLHEKKVASPNTIYTAWSGFDEKDIEETNKRWKEVNHVDDGSFFFDSWVSPFSGTKEKENTMILNEHGKTALSSLLNDSKYVSKEKVFFHSVVEKICKEPLLLKMFS